MAGSPSTTYGLGAVANADAQTADMLCVIGHPAGVPKRIEAGPLTALAGNQIRYNDIDTLGGNSGSAIWQSPSGNIVGVHTNGGCNASGTGFRCRGFASSAPSWACTRLALASRRSRRGARS